MHTHKHTGNIRIEATTVKRERRGIEKRETGNNWPLFPLFPVLLHTLYIYIYIYVLRVVAAAVSLIIHTTVTAYCLQAILPRASKHDNASARAWIPTQLRAFFCTRVYVCVCVRHVSIPHSISHWPTLDSIHQPVVVLFKSLSRSSLLLEAVIADGLASSSFSFVPFHFFFSIIIMSLSFLSPPVRHCSILFNLLLYPFRSTKSNQTTKKSMKRMKKQVHVIAIFQCNLFKCFFLVFFLNLSLT